jgi:hypothetical protein
MNITTAFNQKNFLIPEANFTTESHKSLISSIMKKHGELEIHEIKIIDDNEEYDSFYVKTSNGSFCIKLSFDNVAIFYDYMVLKGIQSLNIAPVAIDRNEIEFGKTVYYTIQTFEYSSNLFELGSSSLLHKDYQNFNLSFFKLASFMPPQEVHTYLDNTETHLEYSKNAFNLIENLVPTIYKEDFKQLKIIYDDTYLEMMNIYNLKKDSIKQFNLVHGNLDASTILENSFKFKFINFENCFIGSPYYDIFNLVYEIQMSGMKEFDFVTQKIVELGFSKSKNECGKELSEYKICKQIWIRKKLLDILKEYALEVLVKNKTKYDKVAKIGKDISNHFYRFEEITAFRLNKNLITKELSTLILEV